jgi:gamma-butyrobetaine dioxygenase
MPTHDLPAPANGAAALETIFALFAQHGQAAYLGEPVSQTEHALQAGWAAEQAGASNALIAAALLHDLGHLLDARAADPAVIGADLGHEDQGARWLSRWFGPAVVRPIQLHVAAKRYLCATEPGYFDRLSAASVASLRLQGGPLTPAEVEAFHRDPHAADAIALRRWDEQAKVAGLTTPPLEHYRHHLEAALKPAGSVQ